jgi:hypothetical protein
MVIVLDTPPVLLRSKMACRRLPAPLSALLETVKEVPHKETEKAIKTCKIKNFTNLIFIPF